MSTGRRVPRIFKPGLPGSVRKCLVHINLSYFASPEGGIYALLELPSIVDRYLVLER